MLTISEITLPETVDDAWREYQRITHDHNDELVGGPQWDVSFEAALAAARADTEHEVHRYLAHLDGVAVAHANTRVNLLDSPDTINVFICTMREFRGRGIGRALAEHLRMVASGYAVHQAWAMCPVPVPGDDALTPPTGAGAAPAHHPAVKLALDYGFAFEQVERVSRYDFATPSIDPAAALAEAMSHAGVDYEIVAWEGPADDEMLADLCRLRELMYTDTPAGGMTVPEAKWDVDRMRASDEERLLSNRMFRTVVRHIPSGTVVGLNELMLDRSNPEAFVDQWDTVVLPEHRGRRLGMAVKAANLIALKEAVPTASSIITWNAEENRHMLAVNEALGFYPILAEAAFERRG
ncbi:GNAT family N-acetyltransferase [Tessaracoccus massiliensis]|uniref:GNAT family N-acetyltransferase n=1 Tax=Tessaracoccus massiliensis TaxID=1522311 RepID=UPI00059137D2|nr:GNAT family N-acetyltransferase [Tessaracoccus massiliensis]